MRVGESASPPTRAPESDDRPLASPGRGSVHAEPDLFTHLGLFLTTLSLLQLELTLTRIFSVTMWYHFAFMAISLAMFGLAAGAVVVELRPRANPHHTLTRAALTFAIASAGCFALQTYVPADPQTSMLWTAVAFMIISVPFVFAGIVICIALTRFPGHAGALYASDLAGSALACILAIPFLNHVDAPTAVLLNAAIAALAALAFSRAAGAAATRRLSATGLLVFGLLLLVALVNPWVRLVDVRWIKGQWTVGSARAQPTSGGGWEEWKIGATSRSVLYEKWNALSRIHVLPGESRPFGWGLSSRFPATYTVDQLYLFIDAAAGTVITRFDGDPARLRHLKYDVTALAHYLRPNASALVIGVGGGRDILTALVFGQKRVVGVEVNPDMVKLLTERFADYSGHLDRRPGVVLVNDEARSYVARSSERFDIIQASLIDTWAATSAGAYVLTENGLYTREAWVMFLRHLTPGGILTMSRWYYQPQPAETLRLAALATTSLSDLGVANPRDHVIVVRKKDNSVTGKFGVATIMVSPRPFDASDIARIGELCLEMDFVPVLTPTAAESAEFEAVATPTTYRRFVRTYPLNIEAPTDDAPFFFHMLRVEGLLKRSTYQGMNDVNLKAVAVLGTLLAVVLGLSAGAIALPLVRRDVRRGGSVPLMVYFAAIGLGFMMVEIGQLERLVIFLGHPMYGLTVVLFTLLIASSLGSACSARAGFLFRLLPLALLAFIVASPLMTQGFASVSTPARIAISAVLLFPIGLLMGMAFPLGMRATERWPGAPAAWYWAINGAFSVISSVLALVVAIFWGVTVTLVVGLLAYCVALVALGVAGRGAVQKPSGLSGPGV